MRRLWRFWPVCWNSFLPSDRGISGTIGTLVALFQGSTWLPLGKVPFAIIVLIFYIIITQVESVYLIPRLVGRRVRLHPAVTFTGIISAALVFGMLGVLLITPTIASVRALLRYVFRKLRDLDPFESSQQQNEIQIPGLIAGHWIEGIVFDLDGTLTHLDWSMASELAKRFERLEKFWPREKREKFFRRLMAWMEGPSVAIISLLTWLRLHDDARRLTPRLHRVRGFPASESQNLRDGVPEMLIELRQQYKVALLTTRSRQEVDSFFQHAGLPDDLFDAIATRDDLRKPTPNSEALLNVLESLNLPADACLVVGDTELHLRVGEAVGAVQVGLLCGMGATQNFNNADLNPGLADRPGGLFESTPGDGEAVVVRRLKRVRSTLPGPYDLARAFQGNGRSVVWVPAESRPFPSGAPLQTGHHHHRGLRIHARLARFYRPAGLLAQSGPVHALGRTAPLFHPARRRMGSADGGVNAFHPAHDRRLLLCDSAPLSRASASPASRDRRKQFQRRKRV